MSQDNVEKFLGRILTDDDFTDKCRDSLEQTCLVYGYVMTDLELSALMNLDILQLASLSPALDGRIKRARRIKK